jgi:epoxyqueuosine reductase QueG
MPMQGHISVEGMRTFTKDFIKSEGARLEGGSLWQDPLLATAVVDARFENLPRISSDDHFLPRDLLPTARSVIVFYVPFKRGLVEENKEGDRPCRNWGVAYVETNDLIGRLSQAIGDLLAEHGFKSGLTPATHNFDEVKLMARWSHKHLAHLAGLGRFGVHHMLITPVGCTGRLGSLVTEAELGDHPVIRTDEACLIKAGLKCGKCIDACPVNALNTERFERKGCWDRLVENIEILDYFSDLPKSTHVCCKCGTLMPCSFTNPVADLSEENKDMK